MRRNAVAVLLAAALLGAHFTDRIGWTSGAFPGRGPIEGGAVWLCPVLGIATGAALVSGQGWAALGFALWALENGCI